METNKVIHTFRHLRLKNDDGLLWLELDIANEATNLLSHDVLDELLLACDSISEQLPRGLVVCSAKPSGFIAGVDIKLFKLANTSEEVLNFIHKGQAVCHQFAKLTCPTLAMIDGCCVGGGLELALALDYRIASEQPETRLGLPEIRLGVHPGFGGTVRSVAQLGVLNAMDMMLKGKLLSSPEALSIGLVDQCVPVQKLRETAIQTLEKPPPQRKAPGYLRIVNQLAPARKLLAARLRKQIAQYAHPEHYPAPYALINLWEKYVNNSAAMYREEALSVARLVLGETSQNLVRVFFLQNRLKAFGDKSLYQPHHVHIIGSGTTAGEIAIWCAIHGMQVSLQDSNADTLIQTMALAGEIFQRRYRKATQLIQAALERLNPDQQGDGIHTADVVIESIDENLHAKQRLLAEIERQTRPDAILATNTSSIPLEDIAGVLRNPGRLIGLHFCQPVAKMPLVEVIYNPLAKNKTVMEQAFAFVRHIEKLPLPVQSAPGFLIKRVLMPYLLEGIRLQQQGIPAPIVDTAARDFGMSMGPLELADSIGLDICQQVGDILAAKLQLDVPLTLHHMTRAGKLGKKSGEGFYRYRNNKILQPNQPIEWQGDRKALQTRLIIPMVNAAKACLTQNIVEDADLLDAGIIFGIGFAPFRGGPLHYTQH